jgi:hypothetical protein
MKQFFISLGFCLAACSLAACQPEKSDDSLVPVLDAESKSAETINVKAGLVRVRLMTPVSEPRACIFPIRVENGLEEDTNITLIGFSLSGPGDDAKGNMFAPVAAAGGTSEARVIVEGQSCDAYDTLSIPDILCKSGEEACAAKVELVDGGGLRFAKTG